MELEESLPSPLLLQALWGDEYGGLSGPHVKGETDLCQKQNKPNQKRVWISHLPHCEI